MAFVMTFFSLFDVPVFWPILLCYWIVLFVLTMRRQIMHMIKYRYIPFNLGKQVISVAKSSFISQLAYELLMQATLGYYSHFEEVFNIVSFVIATEIFWEKAINKWQQPKGRLNFCRFWRKWRRKKKKKKRTRWIAAYHLANVICTYIEL